MPEDTPAPKPNTMTFLNNYVDFAAHVRGEVVMALLEQAKKESNYRKRESLIIKIVDEMAAESEDLAFWLLAHRRKDDDVDVHGLGRSVDVRTEILLTQLSDDDVNQTLDDFSRCADVDQLSDLLVLPPLNELAEMMNDEPDKLREKLETLRGVIKTNIENRRNSNGAIVRFHNKVKHGLIVEQRPEEFAAFDVRKIRRPNRQEDESEFILEQERYIAGPITLDWAEEIAGTTVATCQQVAGLGRLYQAYLGHQILRKIRARKPLTKMEQQISDDLKNNRKW